LKALDNSVMTASLASHSSRLIRITGRVGAWPLLDVATSRQVEQAALATLPPQALMERAGISVARLALALAPHAMHIRIWAGPGNNGGDGLVAARHLMQAGKRVSIHLIGDSGRRPADATAALDAAHAAGVAVSAGVPEAAPPCDLQIDALLGLGVSRKPAGDLAVAIEAINRESAPTLSVDLPSGLLADTGQVLGACAVVAEHTLALLSLKPGCHTGIGRDHAGIVWFDALGVNAASPTAWLGWTGECKPRLNSSHKGSFGDLAVVGGDSGMVGAAWLAARAGLAAGAGRVICSPLASAAPLFDSVRPELMGRRDWWLSATSVLSSTTVVAGCGGGAAISRILPGLLRDVGRLVLDADALNAIAADSRLRDLLARRNKRGAQTVLTPHPLEAARLLNVDTATVQADRLGAAKTLADRWQLTAVLKGSGTVIASPAQLSRINSSGNAALATAGTGDVLAGLLGGLWTQSAQQPVHLTAALAVHLHGAAADNWVAQGHSGPLRATDLIEVLAMR